MSHRRKIEDDYRLHEKNTGDGTPTNRDEKRKIERQEKEKRWIERLKERGGFKKKKAKHWGDRCDFKECEQWADGECAYPDRDMGKCFLEEEHGAK